MTRRSERVDFAGGSGYPLAGIVDHPEGEPLATALFTHCFTCNKDLKAIVRISRGLAALGVRVLRYDLTGLGGSGGNFSHTNFTTNQADLRAAVEYLSSAYDAPQVLIGHSFGGACSLSLAGELDSVQGVIALAAPSDTSHLADLLQRMDPAVISSGTGQVSIGGRQYTIHREMLDDFRSHDLPATLRQLSKPALLLHSPVDETLGYEHVMRLFAVLTQREPHDPPPSATSLVCLPGADHLLVKNPADLAYVTNMMYAWIQRLASQ